MGWLTSAEIARWPGGGGGMVSYQAVASRPLLSARQKFGPRTKNGGAHMILAGQKFSILFPFRASIGLYFKDLSFLHFSLCRLLL